MTKDHRNLTILKVIWWLYIVLLLGIVVFKFRGSFTELSNKISSTEFGSNYNIIPFRTLGQQLVYFSEGWAKFNILGNIIPFLPFGFFFPHIYKKQSSFNKVLIFGFLFIIMIEVLQFLTRLGSFDIDDIFLNMIGICLGYIPFLIKQRKNPTNKGLSNRKKPQKLIYEYISITIIIGIILIVSFFLILQISNSSTISQAKQTSKVIFEQANEQLLRVEEDIDNLRFNLIQDEMLLTFMKAHGNNRWGSMESISWIVGTNRRLNRNLENIVLYDLDNSLYFSLGDVYFPKSTTDTTPSISYSSALKHKKKNKIYYDVSFAVIDNQNASNNLGSISLIFNTTNLESIVSGALLNSQSAIALLDRENNIIVSDGKWNADYGLLTNANSDTKQDYIINSSEVGKTGWKLVSVIPKDALLYGIERMSRIIYFTFIAVIFIMLFLCISIYKRIIHPIIQQTVFMTHFTQDTKQRLKIYSNNEIGLMAIKMNEMLDDIESLNSEIIESEKRYLQVKYAKKKTEIIAYKSQINPHFLYNTLECMRGMALYRGQKDIADIALTLSDLFRFSIKGEEVVTVIECLNNLNSYAKIIEYRFMGKYQIHIDVSREIFNFKMPKLLLQPLVENAVLHGLETKIENGYVKVTVSQHSTFLLATIEDNGIGIEPSILEKLSTAMRNYNETETISEKELGIGVLNVYRRMRLFYGEAADFTINSKEGKGTKIILTLPFLEDKGYV